MGGPAVLGHFSLRPISDRFTIVVTDAAAVAGRTIPVSIDQGSGSNSWRELCLRSAAPAEARLTASYMDSMDQETRLVEQSRPLLSAEEMASQIARDEAMTLAEGADLTRRLLAEPSPA